MDDAPRKIDTDLEDDVRLRALVLGYIDDHPTAMDTLDGIAEWWVLRQQIEMEVRRVSRVLTALVLDGVLEEHAQGGIRFYRRAAQTGGDRTEVTRGVSAMRMPQLREAE
ncbi:MAG: hypothetical protein ABIT38_24535 [Gemmatimonadaceae bacterium]